ncbi:MAG: WD40 repeat domain-containing protein [Thermoguttaceae bacterium]
MLATLKSACYFPHSLTFSPDGKALVWANGDGTILLWDVAARKETAVFNKAAEDRALCVAFSPDGRLLASGSDHHFVTLWDVATRKNAATLGTHESSVYAVAFSPDGRLLASDSAGTVAERPLEEVKLWDVATRRNTATFKSPLNGLYGRGLLAFSPDGKILASAGAIEWEDPRGTARALSQVPGPTTTNLWDVATGKTVATLKGGVAALGGVAFSRDGKTLVSGRSGTIEFWDLAARRDVATIERSEDSECVWSLAIAPDGKTLAVACVNGTVTFWDMATHAHLATLNADKATVLCVAFSPDGKTLATGGFEKNIKLWDTAPLGAKGR